MKIGEKLKYLRKQKKLTQNELAKLINIGQSTYAHWEKDERIPRKENFEKLAELYEIEVSELFEDVDNLEKETQNNIFDSIILEIAKKGLLDADTPFADLPANIQQIIIGAADAQRTKILKSQAD